MGTHDHDDGLAYHLERLRLGALSRRDVVRWAVGAGIVTLAGCGDDDTPGGATGGSGGAAAGSGGHDATCSQIPEETEGPYPADGSNGASGSGNGGPGGPGGGGSTTSGEVINALALAGTNRSDIRSSIGASSTTAQGIRLTIKLRIVDVSDGCNPWAKAGVYVWHCDRGGNYSLYSAAISTENYLRGLQETDSDGYVTFVSIFPACYSGRWPHIHYEV